MGDHTFQQAHGGSADGYYQQGPKQYPQMPPQPQYEQPVPPPQQYFPQQPPTYDQIPINYGSGENLSFSQTFRVEKMKYNDIWAAVLLFLFFAGFVVVSVIAIQGYDKTKLFQGGGIYGGASTVGLSTNMIILLAFVLLVAFVLSAVYFWIIRAFTKQAIWITGIAQITFGLATCVVYFVRKQTGAAIVFLIFSIVYILCFISWRQRIPFSVLMLQTTIDVSKNYGHVFVVSLLGGFVATAFAAWFSVTLVAIYVKYEPGSNPACNTGVGGCSTAKVIGLVAFVTFAAYWITEVIKNIIHVTISGVYGSWYFCSQKPNGFPKGATRGAFIRSTTYSFGSISLGSLIVAIIQLLRQACTIARHNESTEGNLIGAILFCVLGLLVSCLEWVVEFINEYAFSYIALYGKPYIEAAKTTWKMMKDRGIDALVNECLINPVLTMGAILVAYVCAFLAYLYLEFTKPAYNTTGSFTPVAMAVAFLLGLQIANTFLAPIKSGVSTIFVAMAFDPEVLIKDFPDLYQRLVQVYPQIQVAIHA